MVENKKILDSEDIAILFGLRSNIYKKSMEFFKIESGSSRQTEFAEKFESWKTIYQNIYGGVLDSELFYKHTYFALILKSLFIIKLSIIQNLDFEEALEDTLSNDMEAFGVFEYNHFYWIDFSEKIFQLIYDEIENITFALQDLFIEFYQQLFFADIRHKIGEFYTPSKLVKKMVDDFYIFGSKILDPSCGSGNFLTNIIIKILNTNEKTNEQKLEAMNNVFGFDVNPLATITAKINIFLVFLEYFDISVDEIPSINVFIIDSLFPEEYETQMIYHLKSLYNSFDLIIGNPPWITYKDLNNNKYQNDVRLLSDAFEIKPLSQYITHIELSALFFYASTKFLKIGGKIFFIITKSVLNGDHCYKFRSFSLFKNIEVWDFPNTTPIFNIPNICLKATFISKNEKMSISDKYPIRAMIINEDLSIKEEIMYSSLKIEKKGAKLILPIRQLELLNKVSESIYKKKFFQGATLVPRMLVFFKIKNKDEETLTVSPDPEIKLRAKKNWTIDIQETEIERIFKYKTYLNKDLVPFCLKNRKQIFLPVTKELKYDKKYLKEYPKAAKFYSELNEFYIKNKKNTSNISTLFENVNYWNKLTKQFKNKNYLVVYNASGSNLKSAVINNFNKNIIIPSENYYFSTDIKDEAFYLSAILNAPVISKSIKLIKSSRHIHKRPFSFPIPLFDENDEEHIEIARKGKNYHDSVRDIVNNNPKVNADKVRVLINKKLKKLNLSVEQVIFKKK